jgi:hypothetical protein
MRRISSLLWILPALWAIAFSLKSLREPDLWWQIRTGQLILQEGHVPVTDSFSYAQFGQEWINIKWGFEVVAALLAGISPELVLLLQTLCSLLMLWVLYRFLRLMDLSSAPLFFVSAALLLFGLEYRSTGRPEMMTHLMAFSFWYVLMRFRKDGSRWVFVLLPLQILWTNCHEAYGMGPILVGLFVAGSWWEEKQFSHTVKMLLGVWVCTVLAILVNPRGLTLLTRPFSIFSQVQDNKYTTELSAFYTADFWQKESVVFVVLVVALLVLMIRKGKDTLHDFLRHWGWGSVLLGAAWCVLGLMAYRNMVFPYLFLTMGMAWVLWRFTGIKNMKPLPLVIVGVVLYGLIVSNTYYRFVGSRDTYGLQVMGKNNPMGAANYLSSKGLEQQHGMADYLSSSYLLWRLQPTFKTYIDLRDLDVFPSDFFSHYLQVMNNTDSFHLEDIKQNWRYVVLHRNSHPNLHAYLYNDSVYACTYVDPVCAVYEKTDDFQRGDIFSFAAFNEPSALATGISNLFNWAYKPYDPAEDNIDYAAADYYYQVGLISAAENRINAWRNVYSSSEADSLYLRIQQLKQHIKP